ncbi:uncharacterized protein [Dermacentor andersoni]|uniref:uncharacterized protein n=1 Tax=Dermacentor andersoni TaxID=34620 RepID=UPI003B3A0972
MVASKQDESMLSKGAQSCRSGHRVSVSLCGFGCRGMPPLFPTWCTEKGLEAYSGEPSPADCCGPRHNAFVIPVCGRNATYGRVRSTVASILTDRVCGRITEAETNTNGHLRRLSPARTRISEAVRGCLVTLSRDLLWHPLQAIAGGRDCCVETESTLSNGARSWPERKPEA